MNEDGLAKVMKRFVTTYFDEPAKIITNDTRLFETFGRNDPDEFSHFLEEFTKRFLVDRPKVENLQKYKDALRKRDPFGGWFMFWRHAPIIQVDEITFAELCKIAAEGHWPVKYVFAADSHHRSGEDGAGAHLFFNFALREQVCETFHTFRALGAPCGPPAGPVLNCQPDHSASRALAEIRT